MSTTVEYTTTDNAYQSTAQQAPALPPPGSALLRGILVERFNRTCQYCRRQSDSYTRDPDGATWNMDHVKPLSLGGPHTDDNLVLSCAFCNISKGNREAPKPLALRTPPLEVSGISTHQRLLRGQSVAANWWINDSTAWIPLRALAYRFHCTVRALAEDALAHGEQVDGACGVLQVKRHVIIRLTEQLSGHTWEELGGVRVPAEAAS